MAARGPKSDKFWSEAIRMAVMREEEIDGKKVKRLRIVADKIVELAMAGDMSAAKERGDRLDGKPRQATEVTGEGGGPLLFSWLKE